MKSRKQLLKRILCCFCNAFISVIFVFSVASCSFFTQDSTSSTGSESLEKENEKSVFYLLGNETEGQMMGMVLQTVDNKTIVIDGGTQDNGKYLMDFLLEKADGHVDAWFFTHPHQDHLGAFYSIFKNIVGITVDKIYHHFPSLDERMEYGYRNEGEKLIWTKSAEIFEQKFAGKVQVIQPNDEFMIDEIKLTVLRVYDPTMTTNFVNNSSAVFRVENANTSFLILGDLGEQGGEELMKNCPLALLQTDYTQMAHHGQAGVSKEFYQYIQPKRCIWPTPDWLWDNDNGGGFDTGPWKTVRTREWMEELGVTEHYVAKDGTQKIEF